MSTQSSQLCGFVDPVYYQHHQQQQNFQVSPQQIQHLRHLQQQAALHHQVGYPQPSQQHVMAMPQYHPHPQQQQQQQQHHSVPTYEQTPLDSSEQPSSPEEKTQTKAARRAEHNAIERARREHLNTKFQQLAHSLPNLQNDRRPSKGTIIERTLEFVKHTVQKEERYKNEIKELSRANRQLMRQVTSRSSLLAGSSISSVGDEEEEDDDDGFDVLDYDVEDSMDAITTTDDTLSRKSSCSSFAVRSLSSMPTTTAGGSSTTTSPSLDYHPPSMMNHQWGDHAVPTAQQPSYHHHYQDPDMYLQDHGYLLTTASLDPAKQPMAMMNNNLHIKYESSFRC